MTSTLCKRFKKKVVKEKKKTVPQRRATRGMHHSRQNQAP
jgi:hypothetical protein